jgi:N-acetylmuramoyl-L-alanine amidase
MSRDPLFFLATDALPAMVGRIDSRIKGLWTSLWRGRWWIGLVVLGAGLCTAVPADARPQVTEVALTARSDGGGYVVRVRSTERIETYGMPRRVGERELKWVLYRAGLHRNVQSDPAEGPVSGYTVRRQGDNVVLRFQLSPGPSIESSAYRDGASSDLLLNLAVSGGDRPVARSDAPRAMPRPAATGQASSGDASAPGRSTPASEGASKEARERWTLDTIVIDPGHGGKDPGARANGLNEKDLVLDVALQLGDYVEEKLGINVVYTRKSDQFIELEERGHIANRVGAKLFVSIHINAARARSARGTETFFLGPHKSEAARKVMERENSVIKYEENTQVYEDYDKEALVRQTLTQSAYMRQSEKLASLIEDQFKNRVHRRSRGVHQAGFYVLWGASMPAVLVELGFLTNPTEARFLRSDRGKTYMASALFRAIRNYKQEYEKGIKPTTVSK